MNRLAVLLAHLLKWQCQPTRRSRSWELTITEQRIELSDLLKDSPSLKHELEKKLSSAYEKALLIAEKETGLKQQAGAKECPFSLKQIFNQRFFPDV